MTDPILVEVEGLGELEFPDGTNPAVIQATVRRLLAERRETPEMRPMASHGTEPEADGSSRLATAGGMIGSLLGGSRATPAGMALAGAGGAAGQAQAELMAGAREPYQAPGGGGFVPRMPTLSLPSGGLSRIAQAGGEQASAELVGRGITGGLTRGARKLYTSLLKPKDATVAAFPGVVDDLLKDRRLITEGGRSSAVAAQKATGASKGAMLQRLDASGRTVPRETLRSGLDDVLTEAMAKSPRPAKDLGTLAKIERELIPDESVLTPSRADAIKSQLQAEAERGYRAAKMGTRVTDLPMKARMSVAGKAKGAVEDIGTAVGEDIGAVNQRYASLKGQSRALRDATKREGNTHLIGMRDLIGAGAGGAIGGPGGAAGGAALMRLLAHPRTGSAAAIGANELSRIPYSQLLRMLEQAVQEQED